MDWMKKNGDIKMMQQYTNEFISFLKVLRAVLQNTNYVDLVCERYHRKYIELYEQILYYRKMTHAAYDGSDTIKSWLKTIHDERHIFLQLFLAEHDEIDDEHEETWSFSIKDEFEEKMLRVLKNNPNCTLVEFKKLVEKEYSDLKRLVAKVVFMETSGIRKDSPNLKRARDKVYSNLTNHDFADFDYICPHFECAISLLTMKKS